MSLFKIRKYIDIDAVGVYFIETPGYNTYIYKNLTKMYNLVIDVTPNIRVKGLQEMRVGT